MTYGRKAWSIVAWTYDAAIHCDDCARKRFHFDADVTTDTDSDGNDVHPVFASDYEYQNDDTCGTCREAIA